MKPAAILFALAACTSSPNYRRVYSPASGHTTKSIDAATTAIVSAGYDTDTTTAGVVTSKWFHGDGALAGEEEYRLVVTLSNGDYRVEAMCRATGHGACSDDKRPQYVLDAVSRVAKGLE